MFRDFPLDQVALTASMVAHYLPPDRYEPFIMALFASQDRWAFARGINTTDELWKMAALAGMCEADLRQGDPRHQAARLDPDSSRTWRRSAGA